ncbi:ARF GAP with effector function(s) [Amphichorda felina]
MSRRAPNPAAERAAQNLATLKSLLKLEPNKVCADCKRNKHPRWASWNLGVFVCIRCSGIHRGMGTHISRVKSVDLDSWTDEQMQSILSWGNARANKYWEAKLAPGHVPSESKIENFIRTKYELKRWAMDGPRPDPSTLDVGTDNEVTTGVVREKQTIDRSQSARRPADQPSSAPRAAAPVPDLIGGVDSAPPRANTTGPTGTSNRVPSKAEPAPPKATPSNSSLLGLDFLGESSAPPRPASTTGSSTPGGQSRPDLKQSILSLYASAPKPQPQQTHHQQQGSFGGMSSPPLGHQQQGSIGGFNDAFSGLSLNKTSSPPPPADPFASLGGSSRSPPPPKPATNNSFGGLSGGSFFDSKPAQFSPPPVHQKKPSDGGFGDWGAFASPAAAAPPKPAQPAASHAGDLFDLAAPPTQTTTSPPPPTMSPPASSSSVFNLSAPQSNPAPQQSPPKNAAAPAFATPGISGADVWGGNAWAAPEPTAPTAAPPAPANPPAAASSSSDFGWGNPGGSFATTAIVPGSGGGFNPQPKVAADEEFGGWASSTGPSNSSKPASKQGGGFGGADEDLFSNVWS